MFGFNAINPGDYEVEEVVDLITTILTDLGKEAEAERRDMSAYYLADRLRDSSIPGHSSALFQDVVESVASALHRAQLDQTSIDRELEQLLLSGMLPLEKRVIEALRAQPELFSWIKLSGV